MTAESNVTELIERLHQVSLAYQLSQQEIEWLREQLKYEYDKREALDEQLAASQAREGKLREAAGNMRKSVFQMLQYGEWYNAQSRLEDLDDALAIPTDDTALKEYRKKVLLEVVIEWEKPYGLTDGTKFIDRLRRMAEEG